MNTLLFLLGLSCGTIGITLRSITLAQGQTADQMPYPQTHGQLTFLYVNDTLGDTECSKQKIDYNNKADDACRDRPQMDAHYYGPAFSIKQLPENTYTDSLSFYAENQTITLE